MVDRDEFETKGRTHNWGKQRARPLTREQKAIRAAGLRRELSDLVWARRNLLVVRLLRQDSEVQALTDACDDAFERWRLRQRMSDLQGG